MTIDSSLLKQALELQKQIGREPWMDDILTIRAMRSKKVEWGIIYTLIAKKHAVEMPQEIFEQKASSMLRSISATASKKKRQRGSVEGASPQQVVFSHPQEPRSFTQGEAVENGFEDLDNLNPIA